jgi:excinuclease UvrABC helicase subunit UvrB
MDNIEKIENLVRRLVQAEEDKNKDCVRELRFDLKGSKFKELVRKRVEKEETKLKGYKEQIDAFKAENFEQKIQSFKVLDPEVFAPTGYSFTSSSKFNTVEDLKRNLEEHKQGLEARIEKHSHNASTLKFYLETIEDDKIYSFLESKLVSMGLIYGLQS